MQKYRRTEWLVASFALNFAKLVKCFGIIVINNQKVAINNGQKRAFGASFLSIIALFLKIDVYLFKRSCR